MIGQCKLCERDGMQLTGHHLIPQMRHNKKVKREQGADRNKKVPLCSPCHTQIHNLFTEKELEREYNTIEKLKAHPGVIKFIEWIRKKHFGKSVRLC